MKRTAFFVIVLTTFLFTACAPYTPPSSYPVKAEPSPVIMPGYPGEQPPLLLPPNGYPGSGENLVWMARAAAKQCEATPEPDAFAQLLAQFAEDDIEIIQSTEREMLVCAACGCPTSSHYFVLIDEQDQKLLQEAGWAAQR